MNNSLLKRRLAYLVAVHHRRIRIALVVIAVLALVAGVWVTLDDSSEHATDQTNIQTIATNVSTSALVSNETTLYREGTTISEPVYLLDVSPVLHLRMLTSVDQGRIHAVQYRPRVQLSAVRDEGSFWRETIALPVENATIGDTTASAEATLNVSALRERLLTVNDEIEGVGGLRVSIVLETHYQTDSYTGTLTTTAPMRIDDRSYSVVGDLQTSETKATDVTRVVASERPAFIIPLPGYPVDVPWQTVWLWGVGALAVTGRRVLPTVTDRIRPDEIRRSIEHDRYASLISTGVLTETDDTHHIQMASLSDLTGVAMDTGERVIHDPAARTYAVIRPNAIYRFESNQRTPTRNDDTENDRKRGFPREILTTPPAVAEERSPTEPNQNPTTHDTDNDASTGLGDRGRGGVED